MPEFTPSSQPEGQSLPANSAETLAKVETLKNFERDLKSSNSHFTTWREAARRYYRTYAGDPWARADREHLESTERPPVTLNFSLNTINMLVGEDINQRREARFEGVDGDARDAFIGDCLTRLHRYLFQKCDGHRSDSHVYADGLITGLGFSRSYLDNTRWPFRFRVQHVSPWLVHPDPDAKDDNLTDARFVIAESKWTKEEVEARWGEKVASMVRSAGPISSTGAPKTVSHDNYQTSTPDTGDHDISPKVTIYEYCYTRFESWVAFTNPQTQQDETMPESEFRKAADAGQYGEEILAVAYPKKVYRRAWIADKSPDNKKRLLEDRPLDVDRFPISVYTGFRKTDVDSGRVSWFGLMHVIYEPQLLSSKVLTTIIEIMARASKGGVFFESGAVDDPDEFKESFAVPGAAIQVADMALQQNRIIERDTVKMPSGMAQLLEIARGGIEDVSAVTRAMTGTMATERSNVLISNMQTQSMTVLAPAVDPLSGFRMQQGQTLTQQAVKHLSVEQIDKILGPMEVPGITHQEDPNMPGEFMVDEMGQKMLVQTPGQILKETDIFEFHVQVDTGAASPTVRQAFFQLLFQHGFLQELAKLGVPMDQLLPDIFKFSPLPPEMSKPLAAKLKAALSAPKPEQLAAQLAKLPPDQQQMVLQMASQAQQKQMQAA